MGIRDKSIAIHKNDLQLKNNLGFTYANGNMESMNLSLDLDKIKKDSEESYDDSWRVRVFNEGHLNISDKLQVQYAFFYDHSDARTVKEKSYVAASRFTYFTSERSSWAFENGYTVFEKDNGKDHLGRLTLARQFHLKSGIWQRPVFRFFVTQSFINKNVAEEVASNANITGASTNYFNAGVQLETWF